MIDNITYSYLSKRDVDTQRYKSFLEKYHGKVNFIAWRERIAWYFSRGEENFRILVATMGNEYIGQSCAYCVEGVVLKKHIKIWWGVDAFVLPEMRGKGIGKHLQRKLHEDLPNFSSAWYSPTNGIIKRKCGGRGILHFPFTYYPVSSYFTIVLELALKKLVSRKLTLPRLRLPFFYSKLNSLNEKWIRDYELEDLDINELPKLSDFIEDCLSGMQFHVVRSESYLKWKYVDNPRMRCRVLSVSENGSRKGLLVFAEPKEESVVMAKAKVVKIYESLFSKESHLAHKKLLSLVADYCHRQNMTLDGILSLQEIQYCPAFVYPRPHSELLSTIEIDRLETGYITYSDQDME